MRASVDPGDVLSRKWTSPRRKPPRALPRPALTVQIESASGRLELPWISANLSGRTHLRVTRKYFQVEDLILTLPQARLTVGPGGSILQEPILLNVAASATLDVRDPRLEVRGLDIGGLLTARGRLSGPTEMPTSTGDSAVEQARTYWAPPARFLRTWR
jgi:hypothetical protein